VEKKPSKVKFLRGKCSSLLSGKIARVNMQMANKRTNVSFVRGIELFCGITASIRAALSWEHNQF
jgi:hypothetical protein